MPACHCVIFDLDGTLLDTLSDLAIATNYALSAHGLPERTLDEVRQFVGNGILNLIRCAVPEGSDEKVIDAVHASFDEHYAAHSLERTRPYPGIPEVLDCLRSRDIKLCVVSNKPDYAVGPLVEHFFGDAFDFAVGEREGIRRKPWPDSVLSCLEHCGLRPEEAIYVGDSEVDVATARNAHLECVCVSRGFRDIETLVKAGATLIVDDVPSLLHALLTDDGTDVTNR